MCSCRDLLSICISEILAIHSPVVLAVSIKFDTDHWSMAVITILTIRTIGSICSIYTILSVVDCNCT